VCLADVDIHSLEVDQRKKGIVFLEDSGMDMGVDLQDRKAHVSWPTNGYQSSACKERLGSRTALV
jgi:16S rRNA C1402 N4-methylase RsmH